MTFYSRSRRKRPYRKRRPRRRNYRRSNYTFTKKVNYALQKLAEHKYKDITGTGEGLIFDGDMHHLSAIAEGSTSNQREGSKIQPTRLTIRWNCTYASGNSVGIRVIVLQWRDSAIPTPDDILESTATVLAVDSPYSRDTKSKYNILRDVRTQVTSSKIRVDRKMSINLINPKNRILYDGSSTTDILDNALYILVLSNVSYGSGYAPNFVYYSRLAFTDV